MGQSPENGLPGEKMRLAATNPMRQIAWAGGPGLKGVEGAPGPSHLGTGESQESNSAKSADGPGLR
jgi:hypothetical protein